MKQTESPSGGTRERNTDVVDAVKEANSGLSEGGFARKVFPFNRNGVMDSPTTTSRKFKAKDQQIIINKGLAGKIRE